MSERNRKTKDPTPAEFKRRIAEIQASESFQKRLRPAKGKENHWTPPVIPTNDYGLVEHREWEDD